MAASICLKPPSYSYKNVKPQIYSYKTTGNNISNNVVKGEVKPIIQSGNPPTFVSVPNRRLIAVGDLHGDLSKARWALNMAGVLSSDGRNIWTGGHTVGDILDRGQDEIAILSLLRCLDMQARPQGGAVFQVNGNHETINIERDFRYVHSGGFDECADFLEYLGECDHNWEQAFLTWIHVSPKWKEDRTNSRNYWGPWNLVKRQRGVIARSLLFQPGGPLARELARHPIVLKLDDWVFCHGGLLPHHVGYGIERMNNQIHTILGETLQAIGAKAMVVGHTPQTQGVNCEYNCSIWRIDVGMSSGVLDSRPEESEVEIRVHCRMTDRLEQRY
ncbi:hypothetical protein KSS87_013160 [Heliosperma pusillum]|nr:hypothetical protein KSS87_013160 [Heliosperma pusillum]